MLVSSQYQISFDLKYLIFSGKAGSGNADVTAVNWSAASPSKIPFSFSQVLSFWILELLIFPSVRRSRTKTDQTTTYIFIIAAEVNDLVVILYIIVDFIIVAIALCTFFLDDCANDRVEELNDLKGILCRALDSERMRVFIPFVSGTLWSKLSLSADVLEHIKRWEDQFLNVIQLWNKLCKITTIVADDVQEEGNIPDWAFEAPYQILS